MRRIQVMRRTVEMTRRLSARNGPAANRPALRRVLAPKKRLMGTSRWLAVENPARMRSLTWTRR